MFWSQTTFLCSITRPTFPLVLNKFIHFKEHIHVPIRMNHFRAGHLVRFSLFYFQMWHYTCEILNSDGKYLQYVITWVLLFLTSQGVHHLTYSIMFYGLEWKLYLNPSLTFKTCGNLELLQEWPARKKNLSRWNFYVMMPIYVCVCVWCGRAGCAVLYAIRRFHHVAAVRRMSVASLVCRNGYLPCTPTSLPISVSLGEHFTALFGTHKASEQ